MNTLDIIILLLIVFWLGGFALQIGGGFVHFLLVIAAITFIFRIFGSRSNSKF